MSTVAIPSRVMARFTVGRRRTGWVGVDIGSSAIKIAQVVRESGCWTLRWSRLLPLNENLRPDAGSLQSEELAALIRSALTGRRRRRQMGAAATLPMSLVDLRSLELPPATHSELRQMIGIELNPEDDPQQSREFDFWEQPGEEDSDETRQYSVLSLPTQTATDLSGMLSDAGLSCQVIDTLPCALARAVTMVDQAHPGQTVAALDWGYRTPMFVLVRDGRPVFARMLKNCGGQRIVEQACSQLKVPADTVHELLLTRARIPAARQDLTELTELLASCAVSTRKLMAEELVRTLDYLQSQPGNICPQRMWIFGFAALLPDIARQLTRVCELPTAIWQLGRPPGSPPRPGNAPSQPGDALHALLGPAIGLSALGGSI